MELNEIHTEHEHATTSLKVVLLVFAIVLIGALAYLVWASNTTPDVTDNSVAKTTATTTTNDGKKIYTNTQYGFSITYPEKMTFSDITKDYGATVPTALLVVQFNKPPTFTNCPEDGKCDHFSYIVLVSKDALATVKKAITDAGDTFTATTIASLPAERSSEYPVGEEGSYGETVLVSRGQYTYRIYQHNR